MENINDHRDELLAGYSTAKCRLIYLDYDGTLAPIKSDPQFAAPTAVVKDALFALGNDPRNRVIIISGRERDTLEDWLSDLPVILVAEHGGFYKEFGKPWQSLFLQNAAWKNRIYPSLRALTFQYEGSFIEDKHYSLAWHYRSIREKIHEKERSQILSAISSLSAGSEFKLYDEDCTLEFRTTGVDKGRFAELYACGHPDSDFVLAIGDGKTDEDLFRALGGNHYTIRVGSSSDSCARFFLEQQQEVLELFQAMLSGKEEQVNR